MEQVNYDIPYVPSTMERVRVMMELADIRDGKRAIDLGCGDGRVMIEMAKHGAVVTGVEAAPERVKLSTENIVLSGMEDKITVLEKSIWETDLSEYDVITIYGITSIMDKLEDKLRQEMKPNARFISNYFTLPNWEPSLQKNDVYLYTKRAEESLEI